MDILNVDQNLLLDLNNFFIGKGQLIDKAFIAIGVYFVYLLPVILLLLWFFVEKKQRALAFSFAGMLVSWFAITKMIVPNIWFRPRPDLSVIGAKELLFHRPDYSFPSDHATALFALTFGLYFFGFKKAANWFLAYAIIITFARVTLGIHFPLDIAGGIVSALIGVSIIKVFEKPLDKAIWQPMIKFLRKVRLA